jgi:hypothetical protein
LKETCHKESNNIYPGRGGHFDQETKALWHFIMKLLVEQKGEK